MAKYKNMMELAEAFRTGELSKEHYTLVLDNDSSSLRYTGPNPNEEETDEYWMFQDRKNDEAGELFDGNGYADLKDACEAAGIPAEWC
jgi:hypothetical protein